MEPPVLTLSGSVCPSCSPTVHPLGSCCESRSPFPLPRCHARDRRGAGHQGHWGGSWACPTPSVAALSSARLCYVLSPGTKLSPFPQEGWLQEHQAHGLGWHLPCLMPTVLLHCRDQGLGPQGRPWLPYPSSHGGTTLLCGYFWTVAGAGCRVGPEGSQ